MHFVDPLKSSQFKNFLNRVEHQNDPKDNWMSGIPDLLSSASMGSHSLISVDDHSTNVHFGGHHNTTTTVVHTDESAKKEQENKKNNRAMIIGIVSVAIGAFCYFSYISGFMAARSNLSQVKYVEDEILDGEGIDLRECKGELSDIVRVQKRIDERAYFKNRTHAFNAINLIVSGALLALGGALAINAYITLGSVGLIAAVAIGAIHAANHWRDDDLNKQRLEDNNIIEKARAIRKEFLGDKANDNGDFDIPPSAPEEVPSFLPSAPASPSDTSSLVIE